MAIIAGMAFAAVVLWFWLSAHWFGRALTFVGLGSLAFMAYLMPDQPGVGIRNLVLGMPLAWAIASGPMWVDKWRRARLIARANAMLYPDPSVYRPLAKQVTLAD